MSTTLLQVNISSFNGGQQSVAETLSYNNSSAPANGPSLFTFSASPGDNTLTKPTGANGLVISNITGTLKLYSSSSPSLGDAPTAPIVIPVAQTTIVINATASATCTLMWI